MNEKQKNKHAAASDAEKLNEGSPADAEQDERKPSRAGKAAADSIKRGGHRRARDGSASR